MKNERRRERRNITLTPELDEYITAEAERGHRPYSRQVEMMLEKARALLDRDATGTQIDMTALRDPMTLERVR